MLTYPSIAGQAINNELIQADAAVQKAETAAAAAKAHLESCIAHRENLRKQQREMLLPDLIASLKALGVSASELGLPKKGKGSASTPVAPKYRDPASGKTWSGRGNRPKWAEGDDLGPQSPLLISNQTSINAA
jgi:DNA-binding protein H-NS